MLAKQAGDVRREKNECLMSVLTVETLGERISSSTAAGKEIAGLKKKKKKKKKRKKKMMTQ